MDILRNKISAEEITFIASTVFICFVVVAPFTIFVLQRQNRLQEVITPPPPRTENENNVTDSRTLSILPSGMFTKYHTEILVYNGFIGFLSALAAFALVGIFSGEIGLKILGYESLLFPILLLPFAFVQRNKHVQEKALAAHAAMEGLTLTPNELRFNIALLEGSYRAWLREKKLPIGGLKWSEILFLSIESAQSHGNRGASPPYYKFILKQPIEKKHWWQDQIEAVFILRKLFYGREQEIINYIKSHGDIPIEIRDQLRMT